MSIEFYTATPPQVIEGKGEAILYFKLTISQQIHILGELAGSRSACISWGLGGVSVKIMSDEGNCQFSFFRVL
jgi:hypothetical protein